MEEVVSSNLTRSTSLQNSHRRDQFHAVRLLLRHEIRRWSPHVSADAAVQDFALDSARNLLDSGTVSQPARISHGASEGSRNPGG